MEPIFQARCNCLYSDTNLSDENVERMAGQLRALGAGGLAPAATLASVRRLGNWVGGAVLVFPDRIAFSMNRLNAGFQRDTSDMIIPATMIESVAFGRILLFAKTVDCDVMGAKLRFRCNGRNNHRLLGAIRSVTNQP
ncbi:MAG: hypothetical protein JJU42_06960 [Rhodobacteraceae bacterium]|nr:hypothetical protein [Paracoccaceae bacterium]